MDNSAHSDFTVSNLTVAFQNNSNNFNQSLQDFGDGSTSQLRHPVRTYQFSGEYSVNLVISTPNGPCDSTSRRVCVKCVFPGDANGLVFAEIKHQRRRI